jgi:hypothetical protein
MMKSYKKNKSTSAQKKKTHAPSENKIYLFIKTSREGKWIKIEWKNIEKLASNFKQTSGIQLIVVKIDFQFLFSPLSDRRHRFFCFFTGLSRNFIEKNLQDYF